MLKALNLKNKLFKSLEFDVPCDDNFEGQKRDKKTSEVFNLSAEGQRTRYFGIFAIKPEYYKHISKLREEIAYNISGAYRQSFQAVESPEENGPIGLSTNALVGYLENGDTITLILDEGFVPGAEGMFHTFLNKCTIDKKMISSINYVDENSHLVTLYYSDNLNSVKFWYKNYLTRTFTDIHKRVGQSLSLLMKNLDEYEKKLKVINVELPNFTSSDYAKTEREILNNVASEINRLYAISEKSQSEKESNNGKV